MQANRGTVRLGRRPKGSGDPRADILRAAQKEFGHRGFDRASIRAVARRARVNAALVYHYFDSKDDLFTALIRSQVNPAQIHPFLTEHAREEAGPAIVKGFATVWDGAGPESLLIVMLRSATTQPAAARLLREVIVDEIVEPGARRRGGRADRLRLALVGSQLLGLAIARYILKIEPIARATPSALAEHLGPAVSVLLRDPSGR